jgi:hypothetical protein
MRMSSRRTALAAPALACALTLTACFMGYDSRWGQAKAAQQRAAAQATPEPIGPSEEAPVSTARQHTYRIRLRPNAHYLAQTIDAERQLRELVEDADRVLEPTLALHLELDETKPWAFDQDDRLDASLSELRRDDAGRGVDVVVGLIGALPRQTDALHEVGYAEVLGKHVVLRAAGRLGEHDAVDRALSDLSIDERERVVRSRRRHRAAAIFLHEMGHVLGALHEAARESLMYPAYDVKMNGFGPDAVLLMRLALDEKDHAAVVKAQLDFVRAATHALWAPGERDAAIARLEAMSAPAAPAPLAASVPNAPAAPPELEGADTARYARAMAAFHAGFVAPAYEWARPLFDRYPSSLAVQSFRCQLATVRWLPKDELRRECAPSAALTDAGAPAAH